MKNGKEKRSFYDFFLSHYLVFMICAIIGWLYEEFCDCVVMGKDFYNRGFLFGPWLPIYGFLGVIIALLFVRLSKKKLKLWKIPVMPAMIFVLVAIAATVVELITSYLLEAVLGKGIFLWNYSGVYKIQFEGRIALGASLLFGAIGTLAVYFVIPAVLKLYDKMKRPFRDILLWIVFGLFMTDLIVRIVRLIIA